VAVAVVLLVAAGQLAGLETRRLRLHHKETMGQQAHLLELVVEVVGQGKMLSDQMEEMVLLQQLVEFL